MKNIEMIKRLQEHDPEGNVEICFLGKDDYWSVFRVTGFRFPDGKDQPDSVIVVTELVK